MLDPSVGAANWKPDAEGAPGFGGNPSAKKQFKGVIWNSVWLSVHLIDWQHLKTCIINYYTWFQATMIIILVSVFFLRGHMQENDMKLIWVCLKIVYP